MYYKLGQACVTNWASFVLLEIREIVALNWDSLIITNWGKCFYNLGQLLQIRATFITKQASYYKLGQYLLSIGAGIINQGNYYKLGHSRNLCADFLFSFFIFSFSLLYSRESAYDSQFISQLQEHMLSSSSQYLSVFLCHASSYQHRCHFTELLISLSLSASEPRCGGFSRFCNFIYFLSNFHYLYISRDLKHLKFLWT